MPRPELQILVCVNERSESSGKASCGPRGGLELYRSFKDAVRSAGAKDRVLVTRTGCLRHCSHGINVAVWPHNHWYRGVHPDDVAAILEAALEGMELDRLRTPELPWE